ncbi:MAG: citrate synthase/methylcitrate synthase [Gemmatimonadetes bacterium]|nr:citrate synthase/methylcitrate synthase [Gemmatimonadota bacterium]
MTSAAPSPHPSSTAPLLAPPGLKGLIVADTKVGGVRGQEGFFHYRQYDATAVARARGFEEVVHLLLDGALAPKGTSALGRELGEARRLPAPARALTDELTQRGHGPLVVLRSVLSTCLDPTPVLDLDRTAIRGEAIRAIGMAPTVLARCQRIRDGEQPISPDASLPHVEDYVRMLTGRTVDRDRVQAVERYMALTADHGFNASTFTARVIASTGASVAGALTGALAALSGPLHGGAPARVLDMLEEIGDPKGAYPWAMGQLENGHVIMGFGHAVYRAGDPRSALLKESAQGIGGEWVTRASVIEEAILHALRTFKPHATIVTNVEYYAAIVLHLARVPQELFTPTFAASRLVGWSAHVLEQAANNKILRPSARYVGPEAPQPLP